MSFPLKEIPVDVAYILGTHLDDGDLSSLTRTCRGFHAALITHLYSRQRLNHELMYYSVEQGHVHVVRYLLETGASPNITISSPRNRLSIRALPFHSISRYTQIELIRDEKSDGVLLPQHPHHPHYPHYPHYPPQYASQYAQQPSQYAQQPLQPYCWTPLHVAVSMGREDIVQLLLKHKAKTDTLSRRVCNCLQPNQANEALISRAMISEEMPPHTLPNWMPLHTAICHGRESIARLLISHGASNRVSSDHFRITALHTACWRNNVSMIRLLLDEGHQTNINARDSNGHTPMAYAYLANNWHSIEFLVKNGASLNIKMGSHSLIEHACLHGWFYDALRLIKLGVDLTKSCAVKLEDTDAVSVLLFSCCKNEKSPFPHSSLRLSHGREFDQENFRISVIRALIKAGANIEVRCLETKSSDISKVITPLMLASIYGLNEVVETLLSAGADVEATDGDGNTALMRLCGDKIMEFYAAEKAQLRTITTLLTHKPESFDHIGRALRMALGSCPNLQIVKLLLKHAKPGTLDDKDSFKLLGDAMSQPNHRVADLLVKNGLREPTLVEMEYIIENSMKVGNAMAIPYLSKFSQSYGLLRDPNRLLNCIKKKHDEFALFMIRLQMPANPEIFLAEACGIGNFEIAQLLLKGGADPNQPSGTDFPIVKAILGDHSRVVRLLFENGAMVGHRGFDAMDLAIVGRRKDIIYTIRTHADFHANIAKRTAYLENACCASLAALDKCDILNLVLFFAKPNVVLPTAMVTPLHLCIARGHDNAIRILLTKEANIHMHLKPEDPTSASAIASSFWGTTPLEWAINNSPSRRVNILLSYPVPSSLCDIWHPQKKIVQLRYIRAACRRHDPEVIALLLEHDLPLQFCDDEGNSFLSIFCQTIESIGLLGDSNQPADLTGEKSAKCVIALLEGGADTQQKNNEGVSALDHVRRIMTYEGSSHFHQEVAKAWNKELILDDEGIRKRV